MFFFGGRDFECNKREETGIDPSNMCLLNVLRTLCPTVGYTVRAESRVDFN